MKLVFFCGACDFAAQDVAFTPKGGCPLKRKVKVHVYLLVSGSVAFTPKGGCPLKLNGICPEVPELLGKVAFTPKGGCPLKLPQERKSLSLLLNGE